MTLLLDDPSALSSVLMPFAGDAMLPESCHQSLPEQAAQDDLVIGKLGARAWGRLEYFRRFYAQAWGERGRGKPISPRAVQGLGRFLEAAGDSLSSVQPRPSLFLTDEGLLELCWEDSSGKAVQLVFGPRAVEYFIERHHQEGQAPYQPACLRDLAARLQA